MELNNIIELSIGAFIGSLGTITVSWLILRRTIDSAFDNHIQQIQNSNRKHERNIKVNSDLQKKNIEDLFKLQSNEINELHRINHTVTIHEFRLKILVQASNNLMNLIDMIDSNLCTTEIECEQKLSKCYQLNSKIMDSLFPVLMLYDERGIIEFERDDEFDAIADDISHHILTTSNFKKINEQFTQLNKINTEWISVLNITFYKLTKQLNKISGEENIWSTKQ